MTEESIPLEKAINSLRAKRPKVRGKKAALAPFVPQLRELIAAGWNRAEIVAEVKALGGSISAALLRDVLQVAPVKVKQKIRSHSRAKPSASNTPAPILVPPGTIIDAVDPTDAE